MRQTKDEEDSTFRLCADISKKSKQTNTAVKIEKTNERRKK